MLACFRPPSAASQRNKDINKELKKSAAKSSNEVKLLLLGAGESGKSTFAKQMKILHMNGYTDEERAQYKSIIYRNIIDSFADVIAACWKLGIPFEEKNKDRALKMADKNYFYGDVLPSGVVSDIRSMWNDSGFQQAVSRASEFQYFDSTNYFMENFSRIGAHNYTPTNGDILHSRSTTCGIVETRFKVNSLKFKMCDVAGQRSERRKWMHCFSDTRAVVVIVGISEYDQMLAEQSEVNRMHESLKLFSDICNSRWFENTTIILFLNKIDLFAEKIKRIPITKCFPDYTGPNTFESVTSYIAQLFLATNKCPNKRIYTHLTCATDTDCVKYIFSSVVDSIVSETIKIVE